MKEPTKKKYRVLRHIARYRLTIRAVLDRKFFGNVPDKCHNTVQDLLGQALISQRSIGNHSYYELTPKGALEIGLQPKSIRPVGSKIRDHLAILWYCHMTRPHRELVSPDRLREYFPNTRIQAPHCVGPTRADKPPCLYRVRLAGPNASDSSLIKSLREYFNDAMSPYSEIRPLLLRRLYGYAILCHSNERIQYLHKTVQRKGLSTVVDRGRHHQVALQFVLVPGPENLGVTIHGVRQKQKDK
jgi:hypothetical protein